jgi:protein phosphatase 1L
LAVTRAFGDKKHRPSGLIAVPEIKKYQIKANDKYLVLASDGFWDVLTENLILDYQKRRIEKTDRKLERKRN